MDAVGLFTGRVGIMLIVSFFRLILLLNEALTGWGKIRFLDTAFL
jgi:hypothetical protein